MGTPPNTAWRRAAGSGRKIRQDVVYRKNGRLFAILEYKVTGVVEKGQFDQAKLPWASSKVETAKRKEDAVNDDEGDDLDHTLFVGKSVTLMKQITNYVDETPTRYAALFNWDLCS